MPKDNRTWRFKLPASLATGTQAILETPMQEVSIDFCPTPDILLETSSGLTKLPSAEGLLLLISDGWPVPEPMTIGLRRYILGDNRTVLICTQLRKNRGISVAKAWPGLAEQIVDLVGIDDPNKAVFVEHYFQESFDTAPSYAVDIFYLVEIDWDGNRAIGQRWHSVTH